MDNAAEKRRVSQPLRFPAERLNGSASSLLQEEEALQSLIRELEFSLASAESQSAAHVHNAVSSVLRDLVHFETGRVDLLRGLPLFYNQLWAGPQRSKQCEWLLNRSRSKLQSDPTTVLSECRRFLGWYARRKEVLRGLGDGKDCFFGVELIHDQLRYGVRGLLLQCSAAFVGREAQSLWLKLFVRDGDQLVGVRPGWRFWIDDTGSYPFRTLRGHEPFASITPIVPDRQRVLIDTLQAFVPYDALDLDPGRHDVTLEAMLIDQYEQETLDSSSFPVILQVTGPEVQAAPVPSPQALGMWSSDGVTGEEIWSTRVEQSYDCGRGMLQEPVINLSTNIRIQDRPEPLNLELRFTSIDGELIDSNDQAYAGPDGAFMFSLPLPALRPITEFRGLEISIPIGALDLSRGRHTLLAELSVVLPSKRVVCGVMRRFECLVEREVGEGSSVISVKNPALPVSLQSIQHARREFRTLGGQRQKRLVVSSALWSDNWKDSICLCRCAVINRAQPDLPLCTLAATVGVSSVEGRERAIFSLPVTENESVRYQANQEIVIEVLTLDQVPVLRRRVGIPGSVIVDLEELQDVGADRALEILDYELEPGGVGIVLTLSIDLQVAIDSSFEVHLTRKGRPENPVIQSVNLSEQLEHVRYQKGWLQHRLSLKLPAGVGDLIAEVRNGSSGAQEDLRVIPFGFEELRGRGAPVGNSSATGGAAPRRSMFRRLRNR